MNKLLSKLEVMQLVGVSAPTLWQWMRAGRFPRSVRLQSNDRYGKCARHEEEVAEWIANRPRTVLLGDPKPAKKKAGKKGPREKKE